jgi:hypothetical protein
MSFRWAATAGKKYYELLGNPSKIQESSKHSRTRETQLAVEI